MPDSEPVLTPPKDLSDLLTQGYDIDELLEKAKKEAHGQLVLKKTEAPNFFDDYVDFASELTDAPYEFHRFLSYAIAGILYGRKIYLPWGNNNIYPNFYLVTIAPSSVFRKSTAISIGAKIIRKGHGAILPSEFSFEKLIEILKERPQGAFIHYEFKTLLGLLSRDYMQGAKAFLTEIYDNPSEYIRDTKGGGEIKIEKPCVSILAATTMDWFLETMREGDMEGGFLTRFLFIPAIKKDKSIPIPPELDENILQGVLNWLPSMMEVGGTNEKGRKMKFSGQARDLWIAWYKKEEDKIREGALAGFAIRLQIYALKFAMLNSAVIERRLEISGESMERAIVLADWITKHTQRIIKEELSGSTFGKLVIKVKKIINGGKINNRDLLQKMNIPAKTYNELIGTLVERGEIRVEEEKTKGRPTRWVFGD